MGNKLISKLFPNNFKMQHRMNAKIVTINKSMRRYVQLASQGEGRYNEQHKAKEGTVYNPICSLCST